MALAALSSFANVTNRIRGTGRFAVRNDLRLGDLAKLRERTVQTFVGRTPTQSPTNNFFDIPAETPTVALAYS